jgi:hypothetical protein
MKRRGIGLVLVGMLVLAPAAWGQRGGGGKPDPKKGVVREVNPQFKPTITGSDREAVFALSKRIDELLAASWEKAGIKPAPLATQSQLYRRLSLDLTGKIPDLTSARDFWDDMSQSTWGWLATEDVFRRERPSKRWDWVEALLEKEDPATKASLFARHWAAIYRHIMLPNTAANNPNFGNLQPGFENWLYQKLKANTGYDKLAHELLTSNVNNPGFNPGFGGQGGGSPAAFYFANENKAENLAGAAGRVFLGVKIDCAQCHAHPFAKWQKQQFWEFAAFFSGIGNQFNPRGQPFNPNSRKITIPGTNKEVTAKFLDGAEPVWKDGVDTRTVLADWVVAPENPFFAKASVDLVWSYFFGNSLLEPILEPSDDYPVTYPELLDELSKQFIASGYDLKFLVRAIVHSEAYQRSSEGKKDADKLDLLRPHAGSGPQPRAAFRQPLRGHGLSRGQQSQPIPAAVQRPATELPVRVPQPLRHH